MLAATEGPTSSSWWRSTIGSPSTFAERERALAAADPTVLRIWPQAAVRLAEAIVGIWTSPTKSTPATTGSPIHARRIE
jgi:hypothetical protein